MGDISEVSTFRWAAGQGAGRVDKEEPEADGQEDRAVSGGEKQS